MDKICDWYYITQDQMKVDDMNKVPRTNIAGFLKQDCYNCNGEDEDCSSYSNLESELKEQLEELK